MSVVQLTLPMFIGTILNWALFAILLVQIFSNYDFLLRMIASRHSIGRVAHYIYTVLALYQEFPRFIPVTASDIYFSILQDKSQWKLVVATVFILELVETVASTRDMVRIFGDDWGNMDVLDNVGWAWFSVPIMGSVIACVGQVFFAWRIYIIGRRNAYVSRLFVAVNSGLVVALSLVQLGGGIWTGVNICIATKYSLLQSHNLRATATWLSATALCDLVIVFSMIFYLIVSRGEPKLRRSNLNSAISRIIRVIVETGVLCALFAIIDLCLFANYKGTNYHLALCIELSKLYSNSILMILNLRVHMSHTPPDENSHHISDIVFANGPSKSGVLPSISSEIRGSMDSAA